MHNSTTAEIGETLQVKTPFPQLRRQRHAKWAWSKEKTERNRRERRQCGEDLWAGPVSWLWAWSLCGPLLCNIHRSSGSYVSACGCNVHTCTHAHPDTHTYTVQTQRGHTDCSLQRNPVTVQLPFCYVTETLTSAPAFCFCLFISDCSLSQLSTWPIRADTSSWKIPQITNQSI